MGRGHPDVATEFSYKKDSKLHMGGRGTVGEHNYMMTTTRPGGAGTVNTTLPPF